MTFCPTHVADPSFQIGAGPTGGVDCTAHAASDVIDQSTCGAKDPGGRAIRLRSNEPVPDPRSPGLNLSQVANVADDYGVDLDVRTGWRAVDWDQYEAWRRDGRPLILQVGYGPIADSKYDAFGSRFRGNHAIAETNHATYDPGADGRRAGIWKHDGTVYDRGVIRQAASRLQLGTDRSGRAVYAGSKVWCAVGRDVSADYRVTIKPRAGSSSRRFRVYIVTDGKITGTRTTTTGGFTAASQPPRAIPWPAHGLRFLCRIKSGSRAGQFVNAKWAKEV